MFQCFKKGNREATGKRDSGPAAKKKRETFWLRIHRKEGPVLTRERPDFRRKKESLPPSAEFRRGGESQSLSAVPCRTRNKCLQSRGRIGVQGVNENQGGRKAKTKFAKIREQATGKSVISCRNKIRLWDDVFWFQARREAQSIRKQWGGISIP